MSHDEQCQCEQEPCSHRDLAFECRKANFAKACIDDGRVCLIVSSVS